MKKNNVVTLPIASDGILKGLVTIGDISRSYFEVYDSNILSVAKTRFENIVDTLKAKVVTGDTTQIVDSGKVVIAAANPDLMEQFINKGDIVILGNRSCRRSVGSQGHHHHHICFFRHDHRTEQFGRSVEGQRATAV